jgi:hypothetical protein
MRVTVTELPRTGSSNPDTRIADDDMVQLWWLFVVLFVVLYLPTCVYYVVGNLNKKLRDTSETVIMNS